MAPRLRRFLERAREAVIAPFRQWGGLPDASAVYAVQGEWDDEVDTILTTIGKIALGAWSEATDVPPVSRHAFIMASLADSQNFLVRIPNEVADLVFAEIADDLNAGLDVGHVASNVDRLLSWTDSERWPARAETIARTEVTRARAAGTLAGGSEQSRVTGRVLSKTWRTSHDERVRISHKDVDGETLPFWAPFIVAGVPMMAPGDPSAPPELVINCRCDLTIGNEVT